MPEGRGLRKSTDWLQAKTDSGKRCSRRSGRVLSSQVLEWRKKLLRRLLEGDAVVGSRSETWQRRELCCSKKESRVSCRGF